MKGFSGINGAEDFVFADNASFDGTQRGGGLETDGKLWIGSTAAPHVKVGTIVGGTGITVGYVSPNITITATGSSTDLHTARYIVSAGGATDGANYTTIAAAYAAAVAAGAPQTVFIQPGTYTENLTLSAGINLTAFPCDSETPNVTIVGKATATYVGTCTLSGINLKTNGDYVLEFTGGNSPSIALIDCWMTLTNANGIHCTASGSLIQMYRCRGDCGTNTYFIFTAGALKAFYCILPSSGGSTTASTFANSGCEFDWSTLQVPITTSGTGAFSCLNGRFEVPGVTCLTLNGSSDTKIYNSYVKSTSGSSISIGTGATCPVCNCVIESSNPNTITGAGTLQYALISFVGSSSGVNTTTVTPLATLI